MDIRGRKGLKLMTRTNETNSKEIGSFVIPAFFFRKKGYINFVSKSVRRPSVCPSVRPCVRPSVTFLVNASPPKPLEVATSNFVGE